MIPIQVWAVEVFNMPFLTRRGWKYLALIVFVMFSIGFVVIQYYFDKDVSNEKPYSECEREPC